MFSTGTRRGSTQLGQLPAPTVLTGQLERADRILRDHGGAREAEALADFFSQPRAPAKVVALLDVAQEAMRAALADAERGDGSIDRSWNPLTWPAFAVAIDGWRDALENARLWASAAERARSEIDPQLARAVADASTTPPDLVERARIAATQMFLTARLIREAAGEAADNVAATRDGAGLAAIWRGIEQTIERLIAGAVQMITGLVAAVVAGVGKGLFRGVPAWLWALGAVGVGVAVASGGRR